MKIGIDFKCVVCGVKEKPYSMQNGKTGVSYSVACVSDGETENFPCDEEVYKAVSTGAVPLYSRCRLIGEYDSKYGRVKFTDLQLPKARRDGIE